MVVQGAIASVQWCCKRGINQRRLYQNVSIGQICFELHLLKVGFLQFNLFLLRPDYHYTPFGHHGMRKKSHSVLVYADKKSLLLLAVKVRYEY